MTNEEKQIAKELTIAALDKMLISAEPSIEAQNEGMAVEISKIYSKMCDAIVSNRNK